MGDEPARLTFLIAADASSLGDPTLMAGGADPPLKAYATTVVKRRLHQHRFRQLVVAAYGERCTVCRLHHAELLDAAHILDDRDERGIPEVPNGLALCGVHHGAFDAKGHAVRKNVARQHADEATGDGGGDAWAAMFGAAEQTRPKEGSEIWPFWVYPGAATIERHAPALPLSRDVARLDRVLRMGALYRMMFGQMRQEDWYRRWLGWTEGNAGIC